MEELLGASREQAAPLWRAGDVRLTDPRALIALQHLLAEPQLVDALVRAYDSWSELVAAPRAELAFRVGPWAAQLRIPEYCPPLPEVGTCALIGRYDEGYPAQLAARPDAPLVLYLRGTLPLTPCLGIGGPMRPSTRGLRLARTAGEVAARSGLTLVVSFEDGCGQAAAAAATSLGGRVCAVLGAPLARPGVHDARIQELLACGGAVVSEVHVTSAPTHSLAAAACRIVAALAGVVVLPEIGTTLPHGAALAAAAIEQDRPIAVAAPLTSGDSDLDHGAGALAHARRFTPQLFGDSPRIRARLAEGLPAADAVVADERELARLVADLAARPELQGGAQPTLPPAEDDSRGM